MIEPEIPINHTKVRTHFSSDEYKVWKKNRRCFVHENVEIRIEIVNRLLTDSAKIEIHIEEESPWIIGGNDHICTITNDSNDKDSKKINRPIKVITKDPGREPWSETSKNILLYVDKKKKTTTLVTTWNVVETEDAGDELEYIFKLTVKTEKEELEYTSVK